MKKGLPEGTGPPEWTQQPQISVSLQEGGWVYTSLFHATHSLTLNRRNA